jgi:hypothetical protein
MSLDISAIAYAVRTRLNKAPGAQTHLATIKLTHIQECIAAALHHNTLASLQSSGELKVPTDGHYLVLDMGLVKRRAMELGIRLNSDSASESNTYAQFQKVLLESFADDFDGIEVCSSEDTLYERFQDCIENLVLNNPDVAGQMAMANHNGLPEFSGVDHIDLLAIEPGGRVYMCEVKLAVNLEPEDERPYYGHVVKVDANLSISKPGRAFFGFDLQIGHARLSEGSDEEGQALHQPVDTFFSDEPLQLVFALAKLLDVNLATADELAEAPLNPKIDDQGAFAGYVFDFQGLELGEDENHLRSLLPDLTLHVTTGWLDNLMLDRKLSVGDGRSRYYLHGDLNENQPGQHFCRICEVFAGVDHFAQHAEANLKRYEENLRRWQRSPARWKIQQYRPYPPVNLFAEAATQATASQEAARSGFHRWLEGQIDRNDAVGTFARDAMGERTFPVYATARSMLLRYLQNARVSRVVKQTFLEAWAEYKSPWEEAQVITPTRALNKRFPTN